MQFKNAIVRVPGSNFAGGLTTADLGAPSYETAVQQHVRYCEALRDCGLNLAMLPADLEHPDSTFVEDVAILTRHGAVLCRPGAPSRQGEVAVILPEIERYFPNLVAIQSPGSVDGGDICEAGTHFFLGLSLRSNEEGLRQLAKYLSAFGYTSTVIDIRDRTSILHLKSGIAYIGDDTMVVMEEFADHPEFRGYNLICVRPEESYAANCVRVNGRVLVPARFPHVTAELDRRGFHPLPLEMSEFQKMDGGLSCLSLRF